MILFILGLVITLGGVGGVEASPGISELLLSTVMSIVGVVIMWVGTAQINHSNIYGERY
jgi:hypothetical protein